MSVVLLLRGVVEVFVVVVVVLVGIIVVVIVVLNKGSDVAGTSATDVNDTLRSPSSSLSAVMLSLGVIVAFVDVNLVMDVVGIIVVIVVV